MEVTLHVLIPYEITLFSNHVVQAVVVVVVLIPYEITLFSNKVDGYLQTYMVLIPYEITLFSNLKFEIKCTHYNVHGNFTRLFYYIS